MSSSRVHIADMADTKSDRPHLLRVPEAARQSGLPLSTMRKTFMRNRPQNVPPPPPHKRVGRSVYVLADKLEGWINSIDAPTKRGRPTKQEEIARRPQA